MATEGWHEFRGRRQALTQITRSVAECSRARNRTRRQRCGFRGREGHRPWPSWESGSGKSTLARIIALIDPPSGGELRVDGRWSTLAAKADAQNAVQGSDGVPEPLWQSDPRQKVGDVLMEPLLINTPMQAAERREKPKRCWPRSASPPSISTGIRTCFGRSASAHCHRTRIDAEPGALGAG